MAEGFTRPRQGPPYGSSGTFTICSFPVSLQTSDQDIQKLIEGQCRREWRKEELVDDGKCDSRKMLTQEEIRNSFLHISNPNVSAKG